MSAQPPTLPGRLPRTFHLTWPFIVIVLLQALLASGSIYVLSSVRAFVNGESQWTKGQKDAIHYLGQYVRTGEPHQYARFQAAMRIPLSDQEARRLVEAPQIDISAAQRAFAQGGNHEDDINGLILMLRYLRDFDIVRQPTEFWLIGDAYLHALQELSEEVHASITAGTAQPALRQAWQQRIDEINEGVTPVATAFSESAGESSRRIVQLLLMLNLATAAILITLTLVHTHRLLRQRRRVEQVLHGERESARTTLAAIGDGVVTTDEQGMVNYMNPAAERLLGQPLHQARSRHLAALLRFMGANGDVADAAPLLHSVLQSARCLQDERTRHVVRPDGSSLPVTLVGTPLHRQGALSGALFVLHDVTREQQYLEQLTWQATHDALTGLVNRREFERRLAALLAGPQAPAGSLLYVDLDQFKIINDTCGHPAGDEMLRAVCRLLQGGLREGDTLARLGGDEFGVLLPGCPPEVTLQIAQDMRQGAQDLQVPWGERSLRTGLSIGLVHLDEELNTLQEVLRVADMACYGAKERGRNTVHVYQPADAAMSRSADDMDWMQRLRHALEHDRFSLYAQEIAPLQQASAEVPAGLHVELLLRLEDGHGEMISPARFIPAAERLGLMPAIDRWVVDHALAELGCRQRDVAMPPISLCAINLSGTSVGDESLLDYLRAQIAQHGVPPNRLCFEITETAAIARMPNAIRLIRELKQQGCHFSLDDFGSGMSSFTYLRQLPVDYLKIDGALVRDIMDDPANHAMVEMIHHIAHVMGKQTIAEFAETPEIIAALRAMGVDHAQGYAIGRPKPFAEPTPANVPAAPLASAPLAHRFSSSGLAS